MQKKKTNNLQTREETNATKYFAVSKSPVNVQSPQKCCNKITEQFIHKAQKKTCCRKLKSISRILKRTKKKLVSCMVGKKNARKRRTLNQIGLIFDSQSRESIFSHCLRNYEIIWNTDVVTDHGLGLKQKLRARTV